MRLKLDKNFKDFSDKLEHLKKNFEPKMETFIKLQAEETTGDVKKFTPVDTGSLRSGWFRKKGENKLQQIIFNDVSYVNHVEFGHRIGKSKKKVKAGVYMLKKSIDIRIKKFYDDLNKFFSEELKKL